MGKLSKLTKNMASQYVLSSASHTESVSVGGRGPVHLMLLSTRSFSSTEKEIGLKCCMGLVCLSTRLRCETFRVDHSLICNSQANWGGTENGLQRSQPALTAVYESSRWTRLGELRWMISVVWPFFLAGFYFSSHWILNCSTIANFTIGLS